MKVCLTANRAWNLAHFRMNHMQTLMEMGIEVHAAAPADGYEDQLTDAGIQFHPWKIERRSLNPVYELVSTRRLQRIYKEIQPDLVHHYTVKAVLYGTAAARWSGVQAIVNSVTGLPFIIVSPKKGISKKLARWLAMRWYGWSVKGKNTHVVLQNHDDLELLESFAGSVRSNCTVTRGSGVDLEAYSLTPMPRNEVPHVVFVGRLIREKGVFELMEAAELLRAEGIDFRLTACGEIDHGNRSSATTDDCRAWQDRNLVDELGRVDDVRPILRTADIVVLPSYREGTPRSLLEAMAVGRPIIATDVPGCREVVDEGVNGCLVPVNSSEKLAAAISRLLQEPELCEKMGAASRQMAEAEFDERRVIQQYLEIYQQLLPELMPASEFWQATRPARDPQSEVVPTTS